MNRLLAPYIGIYKKLHTLIPDLEAYIERGITHGKSESSGFMDVHFDYLGNDPDGNPVIALSHTFEANGDLVPDPDMHIRIMTHQKMAEALTYQDQFGYREVYGDYGGESYVHLKNKKELNDFLNTWLRNLIEQGHRIDLSGGKEITGDDPRTGDLDQLRERKPEKGNDMER